MDASLQAASVNEHTVRAAAGLTFVVGATGFSYAFFDQQYVPLRVAATLFFVEFLIRLTAGIRYSPMGVLARQMTRGLEPDWVSTKPKHFAWSIGLGMALSMMVITNSGITGALPGTLCAICLTLMFMEAALGICLGCQLYAMLLRRGWIEPDPEIERCAYGVCEIPTQEAK